MGLKNKKIRDTFIGFSSLTKGFSPFRFQTSVPIQTKSYRRETARQLRMST